MPRKGHSEEQIVFALKQVENGAKVPKVCRKLGVGELSLDNQGLRFLLTKKF